MKYLLTLFAIASVCSACSNQTGHPDDPLATPGERAFHERMREREYQNVGDPLLRATGGDSVLNNAGPP